MLQLHPNDQQFHCLLTPFKGKGKVSLLSKWACNSVKRSPEVFLPKTYRIVVNQAKYFMALLHPAMPQLETRWYRICIVATQHLPHYRNTVLTQLSLAWFYIKHDNDKYGDLEGTMEWAEYLILNIEHSNIEYPVNVTFPNQAGISIA